MEIIAGLCDRHLERAGTLATIQAATLANPVFPANAGVCLNDRINTNQNHNNPAEVEKAASRSSSLLHKIPTAEAEAQT
jgi:hypothetical protein